MQGMRNRDARIAGLLYLLSIIGGFFTLEYAPGKLIKPGDAVATAQAIASNETLFRIGAIGGDLVLGVLWLSVVLALYRLLKDVDQTQANLMVILGAYMQVPLYFVIAAYYVVALVLVDGASLLASFSTSQRDEIAMLFLRLHHYGFQASLVFAGLWLVPFGILVYRSGFLPRTLGAWLILGGIGWLAIALTAFVAPSYSGLVYSVARPATLSEIAITLWLLIMGARRITLLQT